MLVHDRPGGHRRGGRRGWPGRRGEGGYDHVGRRRAVAERGVRAHLVVVASPALDHDLGLPQAVEDLAGEDLVPQVTSVTPIARTASATLWPCATRMSTWRSLATISSGLCLLRGIAVLLGGRSHTSGWTTSLGAAHSKVRCVPPAIAPSRISVPGQSVTTTPRDVALHP